MTNQDIKLAAAGAGVRLWEVADALGMHDSNFSRLLRHELSPERKAEILQIITTLARDGRCNT